MESSLRTVENRLYPKIERLPQRELPSRSTFGSPRPSMRTANWPQFPFGVEIIPLSFADCVSERAYFFVTGGPHIPVSFCLVWFGPGAMQRLAMPAGSRGSRDPYFRLRKLWD